MEGELVEDDEEKAVDCTCRWELRPSSEMKSCAHCSMEAFKETDISSFDFESVVEFKEEPTNEDDFAL